MDRYMDDFKPISNAYIPIHLMMVQNSTYYFLAHPPTLLNSLTQAISNTICEHIPEHCPGFLWSQSSLRTHALPICLMLPYMKCPCVEFPTQGELSQVNSFIQSEKQMLMSFFLNVTQPFQTQPYLWFLQECWVTQLLACHLSSVSFRASSEPCEPVTCTQNLVSMSASEKTQTKTILLLSWATTLSENTKTGKG